MSGAGHRGPALVLCALLLLPAGAVLARSRGTVAIGFGWRAIATQDDRTRLRDWRKTWVKTTDKLKAAGRQAQLAAEGVLLEPDSALTAPTPPAGEYRCRTIKLGSKAGTVKPDFVVYPPIHCRISAEADGLHFAIVEGAQRMSGRLYPESEKRMIFLGTLQLGDEQRRLRYGRDQLRDLGALLERVGPQRWRLAFPAPHFESSLDVIELIPQD